jgi:hypothetical protein
MSLCLVLDRGWPFDRVTRQMGRIVDRAQPHWLEPPQPNGTLTLEHPLADTRDNHAERVRGVGRGRVPAWAPDHSQVNAWVDGYL